MTTKSRLSFRLDGWEGDLDRLERSLDSGVCSESVARGSPRILGAVGDLYLASASEGKVQGQVERRGGRISNTDQKRRTKLGRRADRLRTRFEESCVCKKRKKRKR